MIQDQIKSYNDATRSLLDIPIRNEEEYQKWVLWLKEWGDPKVTEYLPLPEEWVDKILDQMLMIRGNLKKAKWKKDIRSCTVQLRKLERQLKKVR